MRSTFERRTNLLFHMNTMQDEKLRLYKRLTFRLFTCLFILALLVMFETAFLCYQAFGTRAAPAGETAAATPPAQQNTGLAPAGARLWTAPDEGSIPAGEKGNAIRYGRELIAHTSRYLGPKGSVAAISNGLNCQNCHLEAGTKPFGNNYSAVASTYPLFRARSNSQESIYKRISDCFERSLNGRPPDSNSREMQAIRAYMEWLGKDVAKGERPEGSGLKKPAYLQRAASPQKGRLVYTQKCAVCHGANGEGLAAANGNEYTYPPLWGPHSYNDAAGLYRLSNFAGYVKYNMPFGVTFSEPQLSDEEAWDVAAFVNSQPRPHRDQQNDWKNIRKKPVDFPFGPYADGFSEEQHKYGPFEEIVKVKNQAK